MQNVWSENIFAHLSFAIFVRFKSFADDDDL